MALWLFRPAVYGGFPNSRRVSRFILLPRREAAGEQNS